MRDTMHPGSRPNPIGFIDVPAEPWVDLALCAQTDPELWFPEKGGSGSTTHAKRICHQCPARTDCLHYAITRGERYGIWGGLNERERREERRTSKGKR